MRVHDLWLVCFGASVLWCTPGFAQHATFSRATDTIEFEPACISVPTQITYEAVIRLNEPQASSGGNIYNEIRPFSYDRQFGISSLGIYEYSHPIDSGLLWQVPAILSPGTWHHIAYCYDGAQQRMYLDGELIASRPKTGAISSACPTFPTGGRGAIGWIDRGDGQRYASFRGSLASVRISSIARYAGTSYTPPLGDMGSDADTMLLYTFEECNFSSIAHDAGPNTRHGALGGETFLGTRPALSLVCCPADLDNDGDFANGATPDGGVDINDLLYFLAGFEQGDVSVDLDNDGDPAAGNPDGGVDINDLLFFLSRFELGC